MSQNPSFAYLPPIPNYPGDNSNSFNTTGSLNHNASSLNHTNSSFNRNNRNNGHFYANNILVIMNNTSNEIEERSAAEMARKIPETLPQPFPSVPTNPGSIVPGTTIHQRQEWFQVTTGGLGLEDSYGAILERIDAQNGRESKFPLRGGTEIEIIIAVMGITGAGKSYFVREVSGLPDIKVSSGLYSCTAEVQPYSFPYAGVKITLVDTPGFSDTTRSDTEVLTEVCAWMSSTYRKGKLLSGIIYLHRITDSSIHLSSIKYAKMLQRLCGPNALQNVLLTTTQWSNIKQAIGGQREETLRDGDIWGGLISKGASLERFMGTRESGLELVHRLMNNNPKPLNIQDQMVEKKMDLMETGVGKFLNEELISLVNKCRGEIAGLGKEREQALEQRDYEMEEILAEEQANIQKKLEQAAAERKLLADLNAKAMEILEQMEREKEEERAKW